ncbi:hypothetical protein AAFF_G00233820 [Aldrovandia affinis]|uniref:Uncharacterized protein n=1 Tax=Aldrovandia affinis TaxID=143900 RepID=A0AAD7RF01_9TELE|nr:hypothetical protein AAFF_G00233820 [Aldrovandia affinis]
MLARILPLPRPLSTDLSRDDEPKPNPWACSTLVSEAAAPWSNPSCSSHGHERRCCGSRSAPRPGLELSNHFTALLHDEAEFPRLARGSSSASRRSMVKAAAAAARRKSAAIRKRSAGPANLWRGAGSTEPATDLVNPLAGPATPTADAPSAPDRYCLCPLLPSGGESALSCPPKPTRTSRRSDPPPHLPPNLPSPIPLRLLSAPLWCATLLSQKL